MAVRGRDKFKKIRKILYALSAYYKLFPLGYRKKLFNRYRYKRGNIGIALRYALLRAIAKKCGDNVTIYEGVYLLEPQNLSVGNNVSIHPMCYLECYGGIEIGNDVSIAHGTTIMSTSHKYEDKVIPIKDQPFDVESVAIEDNVWIGAKATVLCGKNIGTGSVIGAGAVVTKDVPANTVNVGTPCKVIKER